MEGTPTPTLATLRAVHVAGAMAAEICVAPNGSAFGSPSFALDARTVKQAQLEAGPYDVRVAVAGSGCGQALAPDVKGRLISSRVTAVFLGEATAEDGGPSARPLELRVLDDSAGVRPLHVATSEVSVEVDDITDGGLRSWGPLLYGTITTRGDPYGFIGLSEPATLQIRVVSRVGTRTFSHAFGLRTDLFVVSDPRSPAPSDKVRVLLCDVTCTLR